MKGLVWVPHHSGSLEIGTFVKNSVKNLVFKKSSSPEKRAITQPFHRVEVEKGEKRSNDLNSKRHTAHDSLAQ